MLVLSWFGLEAKFCEYLPLMNRTLFSIVIPAHTLNDQLQLCLRSVQRYLPKQGFEVIVVLDGVPSGYDFFNEFNSLSLKLLRLEINKGPSFARNFGAQQSKGDYLFFLDSDVIVLPDTFEKLQVHFLESSDYDAVIGSYDDDPLNKSVISKFRNLLHHYTHQRASEQATTFWGACGGIRKDIFLDSGGFNATFSLPSVEDIELGYRLSEKGITIFLDKSMQIKHSKKWTLLSMIRTDIFLRARPWTRLLLRYNNSQYADLNVKYTERISAFLLFFLIFFLAMGIFTADYFFAAVFSGILLTVLNIRFYRFLCYRFSFFQFPMVILLHWIYYISAISGLILGVCDVLKEKKTGS